MNEVADILRRVVADLRDAGARFATVGGLAVGVRAEARTTRDVDLAVAVPDDAAAEGVLRGLVGRGYRPRALLEHDETGRLVTARLDPPGENPAGVIVDLLFATTRIEDEIVTAAIPTTLVPGLTAPVATRSHLIAMKVLSMDDARRRGRARRVGRCARVVQRYAARRGGAHDGGVTRRSGAGDAREKLVPAGIRRQPGRRR